MFLSLKIALSSLAAHKLRAALAVLGVLLGAMVLTSVLHISQAMTRKAEIETEKLGPNLFTALAGQVRFRRSGTVGVRGKVTTFKVSDATALLHGLPQAENGAPFIISTMPVREGRTKVNCELIATWPNYLKIRNAGLQAGRFFTRKELGTRAKVCVLGPAIAQRLFGSPENAVGKLVFFYRAGTRVVGVMEERGRDLSGTDQDEQVFVPLTTYMRRFANQDHISGAIFNLSPGADPEQVKQDATAILRKRHRLLPGTEDDFGFFSAKDAMKMQKMALDLVRTLGVLSSSLSFAIGGLGILSIMVLLVRARRLEIGIRRAVGAKRLDIIRQFYLEAGLMSCTGGGLGVILSMILVTIIYAIGDFPYIYDPLIMLMTLAGSAVLGLAAGAFPAAQAARVQVLDVLKSPE